MSLRIVISTRHKGYATGVADYWMSRVDASLKTDEWDGTSLMAWQMIDYVGPMLAGDFTRIAVYLGDKLVGTYRGAPRRTDDEGLRELANHIAYGRPWEIGHIRTRPQT